MNRWVLHGDREREAAIAAIRAATPLWRVTVSEAQRSSDQNRKLWAMLTDFSGQVTHHGLQLDKEAWKSILLCAFLKEVRIIPNLEGDGIITVAPSSSSLSHSQMAEFLAFIDAVGAERGVIFKDEADD